MEQVSAYRVEGPVNISPAHIEIIRYTLSHRLVLIKGGVAWKVCRGGANLILPWLSDDVALVDMTAQRLPLRLDAGLITADDVNVHIQFVVYYKVRDEDADIGTVATRFAEVLDSISDQLCIAARDVVVTYPYAHVAKSSHALQERILKSVLEWMEKLPLPVSIVNVILGPIIPQDEALAREVLERARARERAATETLLAEQATTKKLLDYEASARLLEKEQEIVRLQAEMEAIKDEKKRQIELERAKLDASIQIERNMARLDLANKMGGDESKMIAFLPEYFKYKVAQLEAEKYKWQADHSYRVGEVTGQAEILRSVVKGILSGQHRDEMVFREVSASAPEAPRRALPDDSEGKFLQEFLHLSSSHSARWSPHESGWLIEIEAPQGKLEILVSKATGTPPSVFWFRDNQKSSVGIPWYEPAMSFSHIVERVLRESQPA
jgi:regulator of protease activity HflC (stomatin/prohibitin superfamily)